MENLKNSLFKIKEKDYGEKYKEHFFEQYKMYIGFLEQTTHKRQKSNHLFLGIHTALLAILGFINREIDGDLFFINILIAVSGVVICFSWYRLIKSYKNVNASKFKIAHVIEENLPINLYATEWGLLGRGKDLKKYRPVTSIELIIPIIFTFIYFAFIFLSFFLL